MIKLLYSQTGIFFAEIKYSKEVFKDYKPHYHTELCMGLVQRGSMNVYYGESKYIIKNNEIMVFNPKQIHYTKNINAIGYASIHFDLKWCESIQKELGINKNEFVNISKKIIQNKKMSQICIDILSEENNKSNEKLIQIIKEIFTKYCKHSNTNENNIIVNKMKSYIDDNINEQITISDISKELAYNKSYLIRLFKKNIGLTPQNYIVNEKINLAKDKLKNNYSKAIVDLANESGFYDQSHFNKNFRKIQGMSPIKFKKSI